MVSNDMMEYKNACLLKRLRKPAGCVDVVIDTDTYHLVYSLFKNAITMTVQIELQAAVIHEVTDLKLIQL